MIINLCLSCRRINALNAQFCAACGAALDLADTQPMPLGQRPGGDSPGAIWLSDVISPDQDKARKQASEDTARPTEIPITLRDVLQEQAPLPDPQPPQRPAVEELVLAEPFVPPPVEHRPSDAGGPEAAARDVAARRQRRAERRATVRRARLRGLVEGHAAASPPEVLVLDGDERSREGLCALLRGFGFVVHAAAAVHAAFPIAASRAVVAAFVGIVTDGEDEQDLIDCRRVHDIFSRRFGPSALLVGVGERALPVDLVRAELAGCAELIVKPVTRGAVARVFDVHAIAMPTDARRV